MRGFSISSTSAATLVGRLWVGETRVSDRDGSLQVSGFNLRFCHAARNFVKLVSAAARDCAVNELLVYPALKYQCTRP
jgi:hypothetical protein